MWQPGGWIVEVKAAGAVEDPATMIAAYDDTAGVTAAFTRNVLTVVNRELGGDFPVETFIHRPLWNAGESRIEAWLETPNPIRVVVGAIDLTVDLVAGERIHTEVSCKLTEDMIRNELSAAGMVIADWYTGFSILVCARARATRLTRRTALPASAQSNDTEVVSTR